MNFLLANRMCDVIAVAISMKGNMRTIEIANHSFHAYYKGRGP